MKRSEFLMLSAALLLGLLVFGWSALGQSRGPAPSATAQRGWDYMFETGSKAFPSEGDKTKIVLYDNGGWELIAVVREENQTVLVFKRPKQGVK